MVAELRLRCTATLISETESACSIREDADAAETGTVLLLTQGLLLSGPQADWDKTNGENNWNW